MDEIEYKIEQLLDDKPYLVITDSIIKQYIEDNIDLLIKQIRKEMFDEIFIENKEVK